MNAKVPTPSAHRKAKGGWSSLLLLSGAMILALAAGALSMLEPGGWSVPGLTHSTGEAASLPEPDNAPQPGAESQRLEREAALTLAEAAVTEREDYLKEQEMQVAALLKQLMVQQDEQAKLQQVATLYGLMPPQRAAPALQAMQTDLAVQILRLLDNDQTAAILTMMEPSRSAEVLTRLAQGGTVSGQGLN